MRIVDPRGAPEPVVDLKPGMTWWQQLLFLLASAAIAGGSSWAGSHWGGVTNDQMKTAVSESEGRLTKKIDEVKAAVAKDGDDMRKYVDEKTAPKAVPKKTKKPKPDTGGASE